MEIRGEGGGEDKFYSQIILSRATCIEMSVGEL